MINQDYMNIDSYSIAEESAKMIWEYLEKDIPLPKPLLRYLMEPAIFRNCLTLLQGKTGTHKTRILCNLVTLLLSKDANMEICGFSKDEVEAIHVLYIDTERDTRYQILNTMKKMKADIGVSKKEFEKQFSILPLVEVSRTARISVIESKIEDLRGKIPKSDLLVVVIDVFTDLVDDFNDVKETNKICDLLNLMINRYNVTVIGIIHENPGEGDKARGHLGTELGNKASTRFQINEDRVSNVAFCLKHKKSRITPLYGDTILIFDEEKDNLVPLLEADIEKNRLNEWLKYMESALIKMHYDTWTRIQLIEFLMDELGWRSRKVEEKLKYLTSKKIIFETTGGPSILIKQKNKKSVEYKVILISDDTENTIKDILKS